LEEIAAETNRYVGNNMNRQSAKLPALSHLDVHEKVIEGLVGNVWNRMTEKKEGPSSTDVEDQLNGKLHLIQAHDGKCSKGLCSLLQHRSERRLKRKVNYL
jgi:hypothetical protein